MKTIFSPLVLTIIILHSCSESKSDFLKSGNNLYYFGLESAINNPKNISLSELASNVEYIPLETSPDCMLDPIAKLALTDSFIFVSDAKKLLQFKRNGQFIKQIGSIGRGPGEYKSISDFFIDAPGKRIYILNGREVQILNHEGNIQRSLNINFSADQMIPEDSSTFVFHGLSFYFKNLDQSFKPNIPDTIYSIYITDSNGRNLKKIQNILRQGNEPYLNVILSHMYLHNGAITFLETGIDTAFHIGREILKPYAVFDLGEKKMDPHFVDREKYAGITKDKFWILSLLENNDYFFINLVQGLSISAKCCLLNKHTGEISMLSETGFTNDLDNGIPFWPKFVFNDSILVTHIEAFKFLDLTKPNLDHENKFEKIRQGLNETSNPVIIILN